jgi:FixJ family two-component response regulator
MAGANDRERAPYLVASLKPLEREFLRGIVAGQSVAAIAAQLHLDRSDAESLRQSLMDRLGASCTADMVRAGIYAGL